MIATRANREGSPRPRAKKPCEFERGEGGKGKHEERRRHAVAREHEEEQRRDQIGTNRSVDRQEFAPSPGSEY